MCSIAHHLSMTMLSTGCLRKSAMLVLMNFQPSQKQGKQFNICLLVKHQVQMHFLLKSIKLVDYKWQFFQCMWRKAVIPQDFKDASIIHLYKRKGNPQVCGNNRDISLLSIPGNTLAKIPLNRLNAHLDQAGLITESQCEFRKDRGTIDMIFTARQLQKKCHEHDGFCNAHKRFSRL